MQYLRSILGITIVIFAGIIRYYFSSSQIPNADMAAQKNIGIIIGSVRKPRIGPSVVSIVHNKLQSTANTTSTKLSLIDITEFNLPILDEPAVPSFIKSFEEYKHEHTRKWSQEISKYDAFVFVTPQYNWSVPGGLKNAIDYLFHEWVGKPAFVVTYGGHGGGKAAEALSPIFEGLKMKPFRESINLKLSAKEGMIPLAVKEGKLMEGADEAWAPELDKLSTLFAEFEKSLTKEGSL
jgi:NAD(P)H-dependent FMN reductase